MSNDIIKANGQGLQLATLGDYMQFATIVCKSGIMPKSMDTPEKIVVALQFGAEVGMTPTQSLWGTAVINGVPTIYGDTGLALVRRSGLLEYIKEDIEGQFSTDLSKVEGSVRAVCTVKRKGDPEEVTRTFSVAEAKLARLWAKSGPWSSHPQRMLKYKARAFCLRDVFPDVLRGMHLYEELQGEPPIHVESSVVSSQTLLDGADDDAVSTEGQRVQSIQEHEEEGRQERPGLHGSRDGDGDGGVGQRVAQQEQGRQQDVPVMQDQPEEDAGPESDGGGSVLTDPPGEIPEWDGETDEQDTVPDSEPEVHEEVLEPGQYLYHCSNPTCGENFDKPKRKKSGNGWQTACPECGSVQLEDFDEWLKRLAAA